MAVYGRYNHIAWSYLEEKGYTPIIEDGDMDILAQGNPDFIAFNYYTSQTVGESLNDGNDFSHTGDQHEIVGEPGAYRGSVNPNLQKRSLAGKSIRSASALPCVRSTLAITCH